MVRWSTRRRKELRFDGEGALDGPQGEIASFQVITPDIQGLEMENRRRIERGRRAKNEADPKWEDLGAQKGGCRATGDFCATTLDHVHSRCCLYVIFLHIFVRSSLSCFLFFSSPQPTLFCKSILLLARERGRELPTHITYFMQIDNLVSSFPHVSFISL